jgi:hypothetical protein
MLESSGESDLAMEALRSERVGEIGVKDLQGNRAVVFEIAGEMDGGHATTPELTLERVATAQGLGKRSRGFRYGDSSVG